MKHNYALLFLFALIKSFTISQPNEYSDHALLCVEFDVLEEGNKLYADAICGASKDEIIMGIADSLRAKDQELENEQKLRTQGSELVGKYVRTN